MDFVVSHDRVEHISKPIELFVTRGPQWWRRFAERALSLAIRKLGAETRQAVTYRTFQAAAGDDLLKRLRMQQRDIQRLYDKRAEWLLCGPEAFYNAVEEVRRCAPMDLGFQRFRFGGPDGIQIVGINVVMIPWMEGYLLVPKLEAKR